MNIVLIGFMGSGKTSTGKALAKRMNKVFVDADEVIESKSSMSINDIFKQFGEPYFRDLESQVISELSQMDNLIISCGGGVIVKDQNMQQLKSNGIICYLSVTPSTVYDRLKNDNTRPLLKVEDPMERITTLLKSREPKYLNWADVVVITDGKTPDEVAEELLVKIHCLTDG